MEQERTPQTSPAEGDAVEARRVREERLRRFRGPLEERDAEVIEHWRRASPADHARSMIGLAEMAEIIVAHTGFRKDPAEMFPGFPPLRGRGTNRGGSQ